MNDVLRAEDVRKLGLEERLRLLELLWDSLLDHPEQIAVTDAQRAVLDERLAEHEAEPNDVIGWDDLKGQLRLR